jgi:hypothetical protein
MKAKNAIECNIPARIRRLVRALPRVQAARHRYWERDRVAKSWADVFLDSDARQKVHQMWDSSQPRSLKVERRIRRTLARLAWVAAGRKVPDVMRGEDTRDVIPVVLSVDGMLVVVVLADNDDADNAIVRIIDPASIVELV